VSTYYYVVLAGPPPDISVLGPYLAQHGKIRGTWKTGIKIGPVTLEAERNAAVLRRATASKATKKKLTTVVQIGSPMQLCDAVAALLIELAGGGVLISEQGDVLIGDKEMRNLAGRAKQATLLPAIDVTIPDEVRDAFVTGQPRYALALRTETPYALSAFEDAVASSQAHARAKKVDLSLQAFGASHFPAEAKRHRIKKPRGIYRLTFRAWFVKSAKPAEWNAMLAVTCGLGRASKGVLYTISAMQSEEPPAIDARYDFGANR
jgi:hypothetical protein